jgi:hypothetical protein
MYNSQIFKRFGGISHSFCLFTFSHKIHLFIETFIHSFAEDPLCFLIALCSVEAESLPSCMGYRYTEPRFELGPAIAGRRTTD